MKLSQLKAVLADVMKTYGDLETSIAIDENLHQIAGASLVDDGGGVTFLLMNESAVKKARAAAETRGDVPVREITNDGRLERLGDA